MPAVFGVGFAFAFYVRKGAGGTAGAVVEAAEGAGYPVSQRNVQPGQRQLRIR